MADGIHVPDAWVPTTPPLTNDAGNRDPSKYLAVVRQFDVENNSRYTPRNNSTFCNIFLWDVTKAMGCEATGVGQGKELNANAACAWLSGVGYNHGWSRCSALEANNNVKVGCPAVVIWMNPKGIGHVAVVIPSDRPGVRIAQAGATNFFDGDVSKGFGKLPVFFYKHA
jgi:hypothetical protein